METDEEALRIAHEELARALAVSRTSAQHRLPLKPLVLRIIPTASVHRTPDRTYECYIGSRHITWQCDTGQHKAGDKAWRCLARYAESQEFKTSEAAGAFK